MDKIDLRDLVPSDEWSSLVKKFASKVIKPDIILNRVTDLTDDMITYLKDKYHIEGIILDVDETLRKDLEPISDEIKEWLIHIKSIIKVVILSNGWDKYLSEYLKSIGIEYICMAYKPIKRSFAKAAFNLNVESDRILVVGDSLFDDIFGGKNNGMMTALVKRV